MDRDDSSKLEVFFYRSESGCEPVREWLKEQPKQDRVTIGEDIKTVQYGFPIGMPLVRPLGRGLYEVRSRLSNNRISRVIFCVLGEQIVLLHGFIKKTAKTEKSDLDIAQKRYRKVRGDIT